MGFCSLRCRLWLGCLHKFQHGAKKIGAVWLFQNIQDSKADNKVFLSKNVEIAMVMKDIQYSTQNVFLWVPFSWNMNACSNQKY